MIHRRTTLILGAGASQPYDYPLGIQLRDRLLQNSGNIDDALPAAGLDMVRWREAQAAFRRAQDDSVDDFLKRYPEYADITKAVVAYWINHAESVDTLLAQTRADHWYKVLFKEMLEDKADLGGGLLTVITFNYDVSLEAYAYSLLLHRHRLEPEQARAAVSNLRIAHVYGSIGPIDATEPGARPYGPFTPNTAFVPASQNISTCHEAKSLGAVEEARQQLRESEAIIFLGFGYSLENLTRLDLKNLVRPDVRIAGSVYKCMNYENLNIMRNVAGDFETFNTTNDNSPSTAILRQMVQHLEKR